MSSERAEDRGRNLAHAGSDHLFASKGLDTLSGDDGDDFFIIENNPPALTAVVDGGAGSDTIGKTGSGTQVSNVEIFRGWSVKPVG